MNPTFQFELNQRVKLELSNETGVVIGRAEYTFQTYHYYVRYMAADGRQTECWWAEDAIVAA